MLIDRKLIDKAKKKLGTDTFRIMMEELGIEDWDKTNLKCCCPFHAEDTPSFIWNSKNNTAHCFGACHHSYDILDVFMHNGCTYLEAVQKLFKLTNTVYTFGEMNVKTKANYRYPKEVVCSSKEQVYHYLELRKISKETADYLDIRQDPHGNIVFNYYDTNDTLTMVKYRPSHKIKKGENKNWSQQGADTTHLLYNMNRVNASAPLLIVVGELDAAASIESGYRNVVSCPFGDGSTQWINECWSWLEQFEEIILWYDNDESGIKFCKEVVPRLGSWRCKTTHAPEFFETEDGKKVHVSDLNDCLYRFGKDKVIELIANAKDTPVPSVVDLSDVDDVDLDEIEGVCTGIRDIDQALMKLFYGTLTVVSGTPGAGKTSFLYSIICDALDQGKNCWIFSRELPEWMTRNWMNFLLAGRRNIREYKDKNNATYYKVTPEAKKSIADYYRGKWYVYKDDCSNHIDDVIESMTDAVRKYGVKLLLIDNLMTLDIGANDSNELMKQTDAINRLIRFAMKYSVAVILVSHPRKLQNTSDVGMYDISGTSNIVNLAHRTIGLRRVTPKEKEGVPSTNKKGFKVLPCQYDVMLTVIKDRIRGRANFQCGMYYDPASRRFFTNPEEFDKKRLWDTKVYNEPIEYPVKDESEEVLGTIEKG